MPYYLIGNLGDQSIEKQFTCKNMKDIFFQMLEVLDHLYQDVAYRDLKPENILVEFHHLFINMRITNFGVAKFTEGINLRMDKETRF